MKRRRQWNRNYQHVYIRHWHYYERNNQLMLRRINQMEQQRRGVERAREIRLRRRPLQQIMSGIPINIIVAITVMIMRRTLFQMNEPCLMRLTTLTVETRQSHPPRHPSLHPFTMAVIHSVTWLIILIMYDSQRRSDNQVSSHFRIFIVPMRIICLKPVILSHPRDHRLTRVALGRFPQIHLKLLRLLPFDHLPIKCEIIRIPILMRRRIMPHPSHSLRLPFIPFRRILLQTFI